MSQAAGKEGNGVVSIRSQHPFTETMQKLERRLCWELHRQRSTCRSRSLLARIPDARRGCPTTLRLTWRSVIPFPTTFFKTSAELKLWCKPSRIEASFCRRKRCPESDDAC